MGAFLTISRLACTCAYYFIPTTVPSTDWAGIDRINCKWRAGMLKTPGTAYFERGTFDVIPCANGWDNTRFSYCSVQLEHNSLFLVTPESSSNGCHYSMNASGKLTTCWQQSWLLHYSFHVLTPYLWIVTQGVKRTKGKINLTSGSFRYLPARKSVIVRGVSHRSEA